VRTRVEKWGDGLVVRIPHSFAVEAGLTAGAPVEMRLVDGSLVVTSIARPDTRLEALLARVTGENLHGDVAEGPAVGREVW
jgi:antitoxin MazE